MKRRNRSIRGPYVEVSEDGRGPSTAGQLDALLVVVGAALLVESLFDDEEDESDDDAGVDDEGESADGVFFPFPVRLSVR